MLATIAVGGLGRGPGGDFVRAVDLRGGELARAGSQDHFSPRRDFLKRSLAHSFFSVPSCDHRTPSTPGARQDGVRSPISAPRNPMWDNARVPSSSVSRAIHPITWTLSMGPVRASLEPRTHSLRGSTYAVLCSKAPRIHRSGPFGTRTDGVHEGLDLRVHSVRDFGSPWARAPPNSARDPRGLVRDSPGRQTLPRSARRACEGTPAKGRVSEVSIA